MTMIPPYFNLFDYFLGEEVLGERGHRTAIEFRGARLTYNELRLEVDYWTDQVLSCGIGQGDRVALLLYDSPEFVACFLAIVSVGAVAVPINTFLAADEVMYIVSDSGARLMIVEEELEWKVNLSEPSFSEKCAALIVDSQSRHYLEPKEELGERPAFPATTEESPAFLLYTSGSTGAPKGVLHLHGSIPFTIESYGRSVLRLTKDDRVYSSSRLFFAYGLGNSLSFPLAAGSVVVLDAEKPSAARLARLFEEDSPTVFFGVPAIYRSLLDLKASGTPLDVSSLRLCVSAGEALPARIFEDWSREFGLSILDGIGSTEMLHIFISNREGAAKPGSSGAIVEGYEAELRDERGDRVAIGSAGNLWVAGRSATAGYWNRPELTRETLQEGWVRTGDIYVQEPDGYFFHVGRADDCFKVKGMWVSPVEVEGALLTHEAVSEAAVVSAVDRKGLATARAYVVIRKGRECEGLKEELRNFLSSRLPAHKVPTGIIFLEELPRTSTGKVQRYKLRAESQTALLGGPDEE